jgi:CelD/BcsL family acetyltransferase involved in cellulose biosynthesis
MGYFWGGASWRQHQSLRPNELLMWSAIRYWRDQGAQIFDFGGAGDYKLKYGPAEVIVPLFRKSRVAAIGRLRDVAKRAIEIRRQIAGRHLQS